MKFVSTKVSGDGRGKKLGYPTINLDVPSELDLEQAVYAVWARPVDKEVKFRGLMHWGKRPTFESEEHRIEIFIMDEASEWVDSAKEWEVEVVEKLRPVMKFSGVEELVVQIEKDVRRGSDLLIGGMHV